MTAMGSPCKGIEVGSTPTAACFFDPRMKVMRPEFLNSSGQVPSCETGERLRSALPTDQEVARGW